MSRPHPLLTRSPARPTPGIAMLPGAPELELACARVHEACGIARRTLAMWIAAQTSGPVLWVAPPYSRDALNGEGVRDWIDPARLIFVAPRRTEDLLWTMEEILRAGAVALAVGDLPGLPGLTQVRRMHLAAETGAKEGAYAPLGLLLTPGTGGAAGVESRWQLAPAHSAGHENWRLERLRARTAPQRGWDIGRVATMPLPQIKTA